MNRTFPFIRRIDRYGELFGGANSVLFYIYEGSACTNAGPVDSNTWHDEKHSWEDVADFCVKNGKYFNSDYENIGERPNLGKGTWYKLLGWSTSS